MILLISQKSGLTISGDSNARTNITKTRRTKVNALSHLIAVAFLPINLAPVSYTHLTLPTILLV